MKVTLGKGLSRDLNKLARAIRKWGKDMKPQLKAAHERIGQRWKAEAVKRVPVDTSRLKQSIVTKSYWEGGNSIVTECGSNVPYAPFTEFGTRHIAGGRVLAIGTDPDVSDKQAITIWPAKNRGIVDEQTGEANAAVVKAIDARLARGGAQEQMPWLRPSWSSISDWALQQLIDATAPPGSR